MSKKLIGFFRLIRADLSLFASVNLFISGIIAGDLVGFQVEYIIAFFIIFLTTAGSCALNDYFDLEIDKKNKRFERPLVSGLLSKNVALITAIILFILVIVLSFLLNFLVSIGVLLSLPIFYLYSMGLKNQILIKNIIIAYSYVATIFLGAIVIDGLIEPIIVFFAIMGFIVGLASEIMFDIGDVIGDTGQGIVTVPSKFGTKRAAWISATLYCVIMILDPLPFFIPIDTRLFLDYLFLVLILIPVFSYIFISRSMLKDQTKKNVIRIRKILFVIMQIGTLAYLIGVLI